MTRDETRRHMTALVRRWDVSGETQVVFARQHGVSHGKLRYWLGRVDQRLAGAAPVAFTPVQVVDAAAGRETGAIELVLATGDQLIIRGDASADLVRAVVSALRAPC